LAPAFSLAMRLFLLQSRFSTIWLRVKLVADLDDPVVIENAAVLHLLVRRPR
jgi:hypothetical protein